MKLVPLKALGSIYTGNTPSKKERKFYEAKDIPFIKPDIISDSKLSEITHTEEYISNLARNNARIIPKNSILVTCIGSIGKIGITGLGEYAFNQQINAIVPNDGINVRYLAYCLLFNKKKLCEIANNAVVPIINKKQFSDFCVIINPDIKVQKDIVRTLDILACIIKQTQSQLEKLDELVKCRFVEMFGDIDLNYKLEDLCSLITDGTHQPPQFTDSGIPFLLVSNIKQNYINYETYKFIDEQTYRHLIKRTPVETGDLLLSTVGSYGHPAIVQGTQRFCFQRHIAFLKPIRERVNSVYLHQAILSDNVQEQIEKSVLGVAQKTLNLSAIRRLVIPYPPIEKQNSFASFVHHIDKLRMGVQAALDKAQTLFDSLMQEYFG